MDSRNNNKGPKPVLYDRNLAPRLAPVSSD